MNDGCGSRREEFKSWRGVFHLGLLFRTMRCQSYGGEPTPLFADNVERERKNCLYARLCIHSLMIFSSLLAVEKMLWVFIGRCCGGCERPHSMTPLPIFIDHHSTAKTPRESNHKTTWLFFSCSIRISLSLIIAWVYSSESLSCDVIRSFKLDAHKDMFLFDLVGHSTVTEWMNYRTQLLEKCTGVWRRSCGVACERTVQDMPVLGNWPTISHLSTDGQLVVIVQPLQFFKG